MPRPLDLSFDDRSYSPIPPPMPSPQLNPLPLPSPPAFSKRASSSRDRQPLRPRPKLDMEALQSPVFSLKDAMVVESPRSPFTQRPEDRDGSDYASRRPRTAGAEPLTSIPPPFGSREHRRSGSFAQSPSSAVSQSFARIRTRSPVRSSVQQATPPPVPPLPQRFSNESMKRSQQKKLPPTPIQIPELGRGVAEASRTPISPVSPTSSKSRSRRGMEGQTSFLHISAKYEKQYSRPNTSNTSTSTEQAVRPAQSLPEIKEPKRRSNSFTARILRLGFSQAH